LSDRSQSPPRNQTVSFLIRRFQEAGVRLNMKHGQNFLIDLNLLRLLFSTAQVGPDDVVLEVGTGTGSLTSLLARHAAAVVTVEIDPQLFQLASEELIDAENVVLLHQDALKNKNTLDPRVLAAVHAELDKSPDRQLKLVANLPYNIATPVISNLLSSDIVPVAMTVTIQKELADRMAAVPGTKDYSALSIWIQSQCRVEVVRIMPPEVFWPRPKVHSAIVQITFDASLRARIPDLRFFHDFVRSLFLHRRKFLRGVVQNAFKERLTKPEVDRILAEHHFGQNARAEELPVEAILALCESFRLAVAVPGASG
jgi:16S rRNA (adenine1518-N6/adenine1519-N6)-dimethyltransferase